MVYLPGLRRPLEKVSKVGSMLEAGKSKRKTLADGMCGESSPLACKLAALLL